MREEGLRPLVKLLSRVVEVNSIEHKLRSLEHAKHKLLPFHFLRDFKKKVFVPPAPLPAYRVLPAAHPGSHPKPPAAGGMGPGRPRSGGGEAPVENRTSSYVLAPVSGDRGSQTPVFC